MVFEKFLSSSSNSSPSRSPLPSFFFPVDSITFRSLCRLYQKTTPRTIRKRATKPVTAPAIAAVRRETTSADGELISVVGRTEVTYKNINCKKARLLVRLTTYGGATDNSDNCCGAYIFCSSGRNRT